MKDVLITKVWGDFIDSKVGCTLYTNEIGLSEVFKYMEEVSQLDTSMEDKRVVLLNKVSSNIETSYIQYK